MKFKAVLFDLDGTLANTLADLAASANHCLKMYDFTLQPEENFKYFAGDGIDKMLERAMPKEHSPESFELVKAEFMKYYSEHYVDKTVPYEGLKEAVDELVKAGVKIAVVTNKAQTAAKKVVNKLYGDSFDIIMGLRPGIPAKPDPTAALEVMKHLGVEPKECAFVGDTAMDIAAGVNSGAFPVGVLWGFRKKQELEAAGAMAFAENSDELLNILLGE